MIEKQTWFCAQVGRRDHYAVPRALHAAGVLGGLMTDFWAGASTKIIAELLPGKLCRTVEARCHPAIPSKLVKSWNLRAFMWEAQSWHRVRCAGVEGRYLGYCDAGKRFAQVAARFMKTHRSLPENSCFYGSDTSSLEIMEYLKKRGVACVLYQMDPCRAEVEMVQAEQQIWPGWEDQQLNVPEKFFERHLSEWAIADRVVVNSEFSRIGLLQQGVPNSKMVVVPLSFELSEKRKEKNLIDAEVSKHMVPEIFTRNNPLRVLFLGQVMLRKGIQYLVQAAESLQDRPVVFDIVGPINISEKVVSSAPSNVVFHGRATRNQINGWYRSAHVFILPTLSDGFAITQIEAMANGLPVIATPNCGAVVSDGVDGFLVPPRDSELLARTICLYLETPNLINSQRFAALQKVREFSLQRVSAALLEVGSNLYS